MANEFKARNGVITPFLKSTVTTGTPPLIVDSTTKVANLNVDLLDDKDSSHYLDYRNLSNKPVIISPTEPINVVEGDIWWNETESYLYVYHEGQWVLVTVPSPLIWSTNGDYRTLTGYQEGETILTVRAAEFYNNKLRLTIATFTPTITTSGLPSNTLNWDVPATGFSVSVTNPSDFLDSYVNSVRSITFTTGSGSTVATFTAGSKSATPAGGVNWTQQFTTDADSYIRPTSTTITGGSAVGVVQFNYMSGSTEQILASPTPSVTISWNTPTMTTTIGSLSGQTFLGSYSSVSYTTTVTGITTSSNYVHSIVGTNGAVSNATGNGTLTFTDPIHKSNTGTTRGITNTTTFTRPATVTGTTYTAQLSSTSNVSSVTFTYPSLWMWSSSVLNVPSRPDIIDGTGFESTVTQLGNQVKTYAGFVNNTDVNPKVFWFMVRSAASQPISFKTGASSSLLSDVAVTNASVALQPDSPLSGYIAENYSLYGIILQPGNTYVSIS